MIDRPGHLKQVESLLRQFPVVAILGPRQVGKTTLAREIMADRKGGATMFDLERAEDLALLSDPILALESARGLVVIDEIQRRPELFPSLRVLVDQPRVRRRFLILGSAAPELLRQSSESLAGRIAYHELDGLSLAEVGTDATSKLWQRGGFPRSFLARSDSLSLRWRQELIRTYLERDIPALGLRLPAPTLRRFWMMLAHYHGQLWSASELGRAFGVAHTTVQRYLDVLSSTFMVRQLPPWHENIGKRQIKTPKVYIRDTGVLHALLDLGTSRAIEAHPKVGASWEGFALDCTVARLGARTEECFFWGTHTGAELDLLVVRGTRRLGFEFKRNSAPRATKSMHAAVEDLGLEHLYVVHPGARSLPLASKISGLALAALSKELRPLR